MLWAGLGHRGRWYFFFEITLKKFFWGKKGGDMVIFLFTLFLLGGHFFAVEAANTESQWPQKMVVVAPVADLRAKPESVQKFSYKKLDSNQSTQLLFGEKVIAFEEKNGFTRVGAIEHEIYVKGNWHFWRGWIESKRLCAVKEFPKNNLIVCKPWTPLFLSKSKTQNKKISIPIGSELRGVSMRRGLWKVFLPSGKQAFVSAGAVKSKFFPTRCQNFLCRKLRDGILQTAETFVGSPYFFGGRSSFNKTMLKNKTQITSVDCSGLVNLCHKVHGIHLPTNARSQYKKSKKVKERPVRGDLIFRSIKESPTTIDHVMIYCGGDRLIEARGDRVRRVVFDTGKKRFGKEIHKLKSGDKINGGWYIHFGTYMYDKRQSPQPA